MKTRIITAAVLLPLFLLALWVLPTVVTAVLFMVLAAVGAYELLHTTQLVSHPRLLGYTMVMAALTALWSWLGGSYAMALLGVLAFYMILFGEMMASHVKLRLDRIALCMAAGVLVPFLLTSMVRIHGMEHGRIFIMIPLIMSFVSDSGAYFVGCAIGKHKLAPVISPKKSVEGAVGGVVATMVVMLLYGLVLQLVFHMEVNYLYCVIYGLLGSWGAVFGDLSMSVIKRQTGIKDYGSLFPGHGGVLDRFDSMLVAGPLAELLLLLIPLAV
jgi:phosphatidate cytidylyltransferase